MNYSCVAQNCMFNKIRTVSRYITNVYTGALRDIGITPVQFSMLTVIQILKEGNINDLSSALNMDRTTLNRNLKPLIREEIIYVNESNDKRERRITITKKGEEIYEIGYIKWQKVQDEFKVSIGEDNWLELNEVLEKINKIVSKN